MAKGKQPAPFQPYALRDPSSVFARYGVVLVLAPSFCGVRAVQRWANIESQLGVRDRFIPDWQLAQYAKVNEHEFPLQSLVTGIKEEMLAHGASPEAVILVGAVSPFSDKELKIMADKLTKKGDAKPAAKKAEKATPAAKAKGNPEALKKAQEAAAGKREETRKLKIKVLNKNHGARPDSNRANMLDIVLKSRNVGEALDSGANMVDIRYAEKQEFISLG